MMEKLDELDEMIKKLRQEMVILESGDKKAAPRARAEAQTIVVEMKNLRKSILEFQKNIPTNSRTKTKINEEQPEEKPTEIKKKSKKSSV